MYSIKRLICLSEFKDCVVITPEKVLNNYKKTVETLEVKFFDIDNIDMFKVSMPVDYYINELGGN